MRLIKAGSDALVDGAQADARNAGTPPGVAFAVLVSCVGRKLVLGQRVEDEVETLPAHPGTATAAAGFCPYGEIGPGDLRHSCDLHSQTMTLKVFQETPAAP